MRPARIDPGGAHYLTNLVDSAIVVISPQRTEETTVNTTELRKQARAKTAAQSTATLVTALRAIEAAGAKTTEEIMVRAWIMDTLEERYPDASAAVEIAFDSAQLTLMETGVEPEVDYVAVLLANIPAVAA
jgi:hypothetical protein